jgi:undecaprenyl-diphosphatase
MLNEIILALIQALTEFLPISSDGHLALASNILGQPNLFFITFLHLASLFAVVIFTRKEIADILKFNKESWRLIKYLIIGIIPAALVGFFLNDLIESTLTSYLLIGIFFFFTGIIVFSTKFIKQPKNTKKLSNKNSFSIGLMQALALLPGVSRSGMTISTAMFFGIEKEKAVKFSFLMFIPLAIGAFMLEFIKTSTETISIPVLTLIVSFLVCFLFSILFLNLLNYIVKKNKFWIFGIYCFVVGLASILLYIL